MTDSASKTVLYVCTMNAVRSPMAQRMTQKYFGKSIMAVSAGVEAGSTDGFAEAVMNELDLTLKDHVPVPLQELDEGYFDLIVALSGPAYEAALDYASDKAVEVEFWPIEEPSQVVGKRDAVLAGYRKMRNQLNDKIKARFS